MDDFPAKIDIYRRGHAFSTSWRLRLCSLC
jgi:hypothetical protein